MLSISQPIPVLNWTDQPMETSPALENKLLMKRVVTPVILGTIYRDLMVGIEMYVK